MIKEKINGKRLDYCNSKKLVNIFFISTLFVMLFLLTTSCANHSDKKDLTDVKIKLKWLHQAQFAGNYFALEKGYYAAEGINAKLFAYEYGENVISDVSLGKYDFGITGADELMIARSNGVKVKAIAVIFKKSPVCAYTLDKNITHPKDFIGKTVGIERGVNVEYLYNVMMARLSINRSNISEIDIGFDASEIIDGKVDVATGYAINEPNILIEQGYDVITLLMADYGADTYADVLFTSEEMIEQNPQLVQSVVSATINGWVGVFDDNDKAVTYIIKYSGANSDTKILHQKLMLEQTIPFVFYDSTPVGWMTYDKWYSLQELLLSQNMLFEEMNIDEVFVNEFVQNHYDSNS